MDELNSELLKGLIYRRDLAKEDMEEAKADKEREDAGTVRWNVFLQLEKDLESHFNKLNWLINYMTETLS